MTDFQREILYVEDSPEDAELTIRALQKSAVGIEIVWVEDGQQALDYLFAEGDYAGRDIDKTPYLVLLDLKLPKVSGREVLQAIRNEPKFSKVPVVVLTSSNEEVDVQKVYDLGANSYIVKPVDFAKFSDTIQQLGLYWLFLNRSPKT